MPTYEKFQGMRRADIVAALFPGEHDHTFMNFMLYCGYLANGEVAYIELLRDCKMNSVQQERSAKWPRDILAPPEDFSGCVELTKCFLTGRLCALCTGCNCRIDHARKKIPL